MPRPTVADRALDVRARSMSEPTSSLPIAVPQRARRVGFRLQRGDRLVVRILLAVALSMLCAGALIAISGHDPIAAFVALVTGAVGSPHQIGAALNRTTPYLLAGGGVAMCFRAGIINIGARARSRSGAWARRRLLSLAQRFVDGSPLLQRYWVAQRRVPCGQGWPQRSTLGGGCMRCWRRCC